MQRGHGSQTLYAFLQQHKFSSDFNNNYILPMCAAIWSTTLEDIKAFPFSFFLQFFNNHGLLNITDRPQWRSIVGGSSQYIKPLTAGFLDKIHLNSPVTSVKRQEGKYLLEILGKENELFDEVIFTCHSDQALRLLAKPSASHIDILGNIGYQENEVVLHTDTSVLPKRRLAWASWNYLIKGDENEDLAPIALTYNMNILQRLTSTTTFCVTLNNSADIDASKVLGRYYYAHPQFNTKSLAAQRRRLEISGQDGLHFCGAYWYNGFHEDGVRSALDVCHHYGETL
jgi:predicted NAD/FAD-binding protein